MADNYRGYETERYGRRYDEDEDRSGRGSRGREDRGYWNRASDEVRSWFGDEEAERRRIRDEREDYGRQGRDYGQGSYDRDYGRDYGSGRQSSRGDYGGHGGDYGRGYSRESQGGDYGRGSSGDYGRSGYGQSYRREYGQEGGYGYRGSGYEGEGHSGSRDYDRGGYYGGSRDYGSEGYYGGTSRYGTGSGSSGYLTGSDYGRGQRGTRGSYGYGQSYGDDDYNRGSSSPYYSYTEMWLIPGPFTGRGPSNYQRSDSRITEDVSERLQQHGQIDASDISVTAHNGEVTLSGSVNSRLEKRLAEDVTESCSGVKEVHNNLRVTSREQGQQSQQWSQSQRGQQTTGSPSGHQTSPRSKTTTT